MTTTGNQTPHHVTGVAGGGFAVTWADANTNTIRGQLFDDGGAKVGGETVVNTEDYSTQTEPHAVARPGGGHFVLWSSYNNETFSWDIRAQRFDATGAAVGAEFTVNTTTAGSQQRPAAATLSNGFVAVWYTDADGGDIRAQRFDADGAAVGAEFTVNSATANYQDDPQVVPLTGGGFVVVWTSNTGDSSGYGVKARLFDADGAALGVEFLVNVSELSTQYQPSVAATADGGFFVAWYSDYVNGAYTYDMVGRQFATDGTPAPEGEIVLNQGSADTPQNPSVVGLSNGLIAAAWNIGPSGGNGDGDGEAVMQRLFAPSGSTVVLPQGPVIDGLSDTVSFTEAALNAAAQLIDTAVAVSDADSADFGGGRLTVRRINAVDDFGVFGTSAATRDVLGLRDQGDGAGQIGVTGAAVRFGGVQIGTIVSDGADGRPLEVVLDATATAAAVEALIENLTYRTLSDDPDPEVLLALYLEDGAGGAATPQVVRIAIEPEADAPQPIGAAETQVNSYVDGNQYEPDVATLPGGGWVVVWRSDGQDGSSAGVYGQRYDAIGAPVGGEFRVNVNANGGQYQPAVASIAGGTDAGGFVVVWYDDSDSAQGYVRSRRYDADGAALGAEVAVPTTLYSTQFQPDVAGFADGGFVVTWSAYAQATSTYDIRAQRFDAVGAKAGGEITVNTVTDSTQYEPQVAVLAGGSFVVTWEDQSGADGAGQGVRARVFNAAGAPAGAEFGVNTYTPGTQDSPALAALDGGGFMIAWSGWTSQGGQDIFIQSYGVDGDRIDGEQRLNATLGGTDYEPRLDRLANGDVVVTWTDTSGADGSGYRVVQRIVGDPANYAAPENNPAIAGLNPIRMLDEAALNAAPQLLDVDGAVAVSDLDSANFAGGRIEVARVDLNDVQTQFGPPDDNTQDNLGVRNQGVGAGQIGVSGVTVTFSGATIGTIESDGQAGAPLSVTLTANATPLALAALIANLTYANPSDDPEATRQFRLTLTDGDGGVAQPQTVTVQIAPEVEAPQAATDERQTNTKIDSTQDTSRVAALSDGGYVVTWRSYDQDSPFTYGVYAQRYDASGAPAGVEFRVNTATASSQDEPDVAGLTGGGFVVVWSDAANSAQGYVRAHRYDASGAAQGGEIQVPTALYSTQDQPRVAATADGGFAVAWRSYVQATFSYDVIVQRFDAAGTKLGGEVTVNTTTASTQADPAIALLSDGGLVVVWTDQNGADGSGSGVFSQRLSAAGVKLGAEFQVNSFNEYNEYEPTVAALDGGGFVVAWRADGSRDGSSAAVYAQRYDAAGAPVGGEFLVNDLTVGGQYQPQAIALPGGGFVIAYYSDSGQDGSSGGVFAQTYNPDGSRLDGAVLLNQQTQSNQYQPALAALKGANVGDYVASWTSNNSGPAGDGSGEGVFHRLFGDAADFTPASAAPALSDLIAERQVAAAATSTLIDPDVLVIDPDSADFSGGALELRWLDHRADAFEQIGLQTGGRVTVSGATVSVDGTTVGAIDAALNGANGADLRIAFTAGATPARVTVLIEALSYANTAVTPAQGDRSLGITLTDGDGGVSQPRAVTINVLNSVTTPSLQLSDLGPEVVFDEAAVQAGAQVVDGAASFVHETAVGFDGGRLDVTYSQSVTARDNGPLEMLGVLNQGAGARQIGVAGSAVSYEGVVIGVLDGALNGENGANLRVTLNASATPEAIEALIEAVTYRNLSDGPAATRDLRFRVTAQDSTSTSDRTVTVRITPEDDSPFSALNGETQVNSHTPNQQSSAAVAAANGGHVVVWASYDQDAASTWGVYAQTYDLYGAPLSGEIRINTTTSGNQYEPAVVGLPPQPGQPGGFAVVWWDGSGRDGSGSGIVARILDADGDGAAEFVVNQQTSSSQASPTIARLSNGNLLIAWESATSAGAGDGAGSGVIGRLFSPAGAALTGDIVLNTTIASTQQEVAVAPNGAGGFVAVWSSYDQDAASTYGVYAQRFDAAGAKVGGEFAVNTSTAGNQTDPAVAQIGDGGFVVVWADQSGLDGSSWGIFQQRFTAAGVKVGGEELVNEFTGSQQYEPAVTALATGGWLVAWTDPNGLYGGSSWDVVALEFGADGARRDGVFRINEQASSTQDEPALALLDDGRVAAVWTSQASGTAGDGSSTGVFQRLYGDPALVTTSAAPVLDGVAGTVAVDEAAANAGYVSIAPLAVVSDADSADFAGGRFHVVRINSYQATEQFAAPDGLTQDRLGFVSPRVAVVGTDVRVDGVSVGTLAEDGQNGAPLEVLLNAGATSARVQALAQALAWRTDSDDPADSRSFRVTLSDGDGGAAAPQIVTIAVTPEINGYGPVDGERQVNTFTTNQQDYSAVAALAGADGGHVAVWTSYLQDNSDGWGIFGQRFDANGVPLGGELQINTTFEGSQHYPSVAALSTGGFVVGWEGAGPGDNSGVFVQIFDAGGAKVGGETRLNDSISGTESDVRLAANGAGQFAAVWTDSNGDSSGYGVRGRLYDAAGNALSADTLINVTEVSTQYQPHLTALTGGGWAVVWSSYDQDTTNTYGVFGRLLDANGAPAGAEFAVNTRVEGQQHAKGVAGLTGGGFVVVWENQNDDDGSSYGIYARSFAANGTPLGDEFLVNEVTSSSQTTPTITALTDGGFVIGWQDPNSLDGSGWAVVGQRYAADGARIDGQFVINQQGTSTQDSVALAGLPNGGFVASWTSQTSGDAGDGSSTGVFQRLFGDPADFDIDGGPELDAINPTVAYAENTINFAPQLVDADAAAVVVDRGDVGFDGGFVRVERVVTSTAFADQINPPDGLTQDILGLRTGGGVAIVAGAVTVDGVLVGQIVENGQGGQPFEIALNDSATAALVERLVENLTYRNASNDPEPTRTLQVQIGDAAGRVSEPSIVTVSIAPERDGVAPVPSFEERQANTTTASEQIQPHVAAIDGGFVMVWQSYDQDAPNTYGVYGQRFDLDGNKVDGEFLVNTTVAGYQIEPRVTALDGGGFAVTWMDQSGTDGSSYGVFLQRYAANGAAQGGETVVNSTTASTQGWQDVTLLSNGDFVVTWEANQTGATSYDVYARVFNGTTGAPLGGEFKINTFLTGNQDYPAVTALADGGFLIAWESPQDGSSTGVYAQRYAPAGGGYAAAGAEFQLNGYTDSTQDQVAVAGLLGGGFVAVWESNGQDGSGDGVFAQIYTAAGAPDGAEFRVNSVRSSTQHEPQVAALSNGGFVVVYADASGADGSGWGVFAQQYDQTGARIDGAVQVNSQTQSTQNQPTVAALPGGGFVVGWRSDTSGPAGDGSGSGVFYQIFGNNPPAVSDITANGVEDQTLAFDAVLFQDGFVDDDGQPLAAIRIGALPVSGQLLLNGAPASGGDEIGVAALAAGQLVYAPNPDFNGADGFSWTGTDGIAYSPDAALTRIEIAPVNDPVGLEAGPNATISEGSSFVRQIALADPDTDTFTVRVNYGEGAADVVFNTASKTPTLSQLYTAEGVYTVTVEVFDNAGSVETDSFTVTVANAAPQARNDYLFTDEDTALSGNLFQSNSFGADTDPGGDPFTVTAVNGAAYTPGTPLALPSGATITIGADGAIAYDPTTSASLQALADGQNAQDVFTYLITDDGGLSSTATVTVFVSGADDNVDARDDAFPVDEDSTVTGSVFADNGDGPDLDPEGDALTVVSVNGQAGNVGAPVALSGGGVLTIGVDGSFSFAAAGQYEELGVGETRVLTASYVVSEGGAGLTASADVTITVTGVNDDPVAQNDFVSTAFQTVTAEIAVLGNDFDVDGDTLTVSGFTNPANGSVAQVQPGRFVYTPNAGFSGADSFTYTVSDGQGGSDTATVAITVAAAANTNPVAQNDTATVAEDGSIVIDVLANDSDADGDAVSIASFGQGAAGSVSLVAGGLLYTPAANFNGADSFTYQIGDGRGGFAAATVSVTVTPVNDDPTAVADTFTVSEDAGATVLDVLANDSDIDGDPIAVTAVDATGLLGAVTIAVDGLSVSYDPAGQFESLAAGQTTTESFTYTTAEGQGGAATASVTMTIEGRNDAPVFAGLPANFDVLENTTAVAVVAATDVDAGAALSFSIAGGADAALFAIDAATGALRFLAAPDFETPGDADGDNVFALTLGVSDGAATTTQAVTVTVRDVDEGAAATVAIAVSETSAAEGDSGSRPVTFTVTRSGDTSNAVTVSLTAFGSAAAAAADFTGSIPSSVVIGAGETEASFVLSVLGDIDPEADETIGIEITGLDRADHAVAIVSATHAILNDDADPVAVNDSGAGFVTDEDSAFTTASVLANDSDPDGDLPLAVTAVDVTSLKGMLTNNGDGTFGYDPNGAFEALNANDFALDSFTYTLVDAAGATATATAAIRVNGVNDAPTLTGTTAAAIEDGPAVDVDLAPLGDDADAEDDGTTLGYAIVSQPAEGSAAISGATLSFDPGAGFQNLAAGQTRQVTVQVQATDARGAISTVEDVIVTVAGVNDAPVFAGLPANFDVLENTTAVAVVAATDVDAGAALSFSIAGGADAALFAIDAATGALRFLAAPDFETPGDADGDNIFALTLGVSDGAATTTQAVTVTVRDVDEGGGNRAPTLVDDGGVGFTTDEDTAFTTASVLDNDSDLDGDTLVFVDFDASGAQGLVSHLGAGVFSYDPDGAFEALNAGETGADSFTYRVSDGVETRTATVTITVEGVNDAPPLNVIDMAPLQTKAIGTDGADVILIDRSRSSQVLGGDGDDIFVFGETASDGFRDVAYVRDFEQGHDLIDLSGANYSLRTLGGNSIVMLDTPDRDTLYVTGVTLTAADFTDVWTNGGLV